MPVRRVAFISMLMLFASCALAGTSPGRVGAYMNFGRGYSDTPEKLTAFVNEAADAGIRFLLPMATTSSGMAMYDSKVLPRAKTDFDRLKTLIDAAHKRGLKVHPWVIVNSQGTKVMEAHPDWCQVRSDGQRVAYLDPSSPDARRYLVSVVQEITRNYDVDGISLDYVRYSGGGRYCFCDRCKSAFKAATGLDCVQADKAEKGSAAWLKWRAWRFKQVNEEMEALSRAVREVKPDAQVSSYVWGAHTYGSGFQICQDPKTWARKGWLDWINPSGYEYNEDKYKTKVTENVAAFPKGFPVLMTIGTYTSHGRMKDAAQIKSYIKDTLDLGAQGVVFFTLEYTEPYLKDLASLLHEIGTNSR